MCGFEVFWVPGTDHAGIATQTVVESDLMQRLAKSAKILPGRSSLNTCLGLEREKEDNILSPVKTLRLFVRLVSAALYHG